MSRLATSLARAMPGLRKAVAPQLNDAIVEIAEIWRMPGTGTSGVPSGGAGVDRYGNSITSGVDPTRPDQARAMVAEYPSRILKGGVAKEVMPGGQPVTVGSWTLSFDWDDSPDIRGGDKIIIARGVRVSSVWQRLVWQASTTYAVGDILQPVASNGRYYRIKAVTTAVSGASEPVWPTTPRGATVINGGVTIEYVNLLRAFSVVDPGGATTFRVTRRVACDEVLDWKGA